MNTPPPSMPRRAAGLLLAAMALASAAVAQAQDYPARPIKLIVPYAPGGPVDLLARAIGKELQAELGQPVVADNIAGASGAVAHQALARATADGYTIAISGTSPLVLAPLQVKALTYDALRDFSYLACPGTTPFVLDVRAQLPVANVRELVAHAKANPGKLSFGSSGMGNSAFLAAELFQRAAGIEMVHVPYKGNAPAMADLLAGHIDLLFDTVQNTQPSLAGGRIRALAATSPQRLSILPDLPTVAESGFPGYQFSVWYALVAPRDTPAPIVERLNRAINKVVTEPGMKGRFAAQGAELTASTPAGCTGLVRAELASWTALFQSLGIKPE